MNRVEQAQQDARALWSRLPRPLKEKVEAQYERLDEFLCKLQDTLEGEGDFVWLELEEGEEL